MSKERTIPPLSLYLLSLLLVMCAAAPAPARASFVTSLSATHIQSMVQMHFPLREYSTAARVSLHDPKVLLVNGSDTLSLMIPMEVDIPGEALRHGHVMITTGLNYNAATGELFLGEPQVTQFEIQGISEDLKHSLATTVTIMATEALPLVRIYTVHEHDLNHSLDKSALKSALVEDGKLRVEFGFR